MSEEQNGLKAGAIICVSLWALIILAVCVGVARADDYDTLKGIKYGVDSRLTYRYFEGWDRPKGAKAQEQNCIGFAGEYYNAAAKSGYVPEVRECFYKTTTRVLDMVDSRNRTRTYVTKVKKQKHMYVEVAGYALDNRFSRPVPMSMQDCK